MLGPPTNKRTREEAMATKLDGKRELADAETKAAETEAAG